MNTYRLHIALWFLLLAGLSFACEDASDTFSGDSLFRRWRLVEQTPLNGQPETVTNGGITEFRPDGTVRYEGTEAPCCMPVKVSRKPQVLEPVEIYGGPGCELVRCASARELRIIRLTDDELVLEFYFGNNSSLTFTNRYQSVR